MRRLLLLFALLIFLLPAAAYADDEPVVASENGPPIAALAIADYYGMSVEDVISLNEAGIGYGLLFKLLHLVESGEMTTEELRAWATGEPRRGWGVWVRLAKSSGRQRDNLGQAVKRYVQAHGGALDDGEERGGPPHTPPGHGGTPPGLSKKENKGVPPGHTNGHPGRGRGRGNGQGQGTAP
jgi:hypothetical protein